MKRLDKEQQQTLRKIFSEKVRGLSSLPLGMRGVVLQALDRSLSEMERVAGSTPQIRGIARRCTGCRIPTRRGVYLHGSRIWMCPECAERRRKDESLL